MYVLTASQMQSVDDYTINTLGISQEVLMEKAALCSVEEIVKMKPKRVLCVCGNGNNGGDGIAVARILFMQGIQAAVYLCFEPSLCKESVQYQLSVFQKIGGELVTEIDFSKYDIIVDAIFGIGLNRIVSGSYAELIAEINTARDNLGLKVISLDIPSGIHADTGCVMDVAVSADVTVTFCYAKRGHLLYPGRTHCGILKIKDAGMYISFSPLKYDNIGFSYFDKSECVLQKLSSTSHKGNAGRILIIAGSTDMSGACYLAACSAFRMGSGLVDVYTVSENLEILKTMLPEAIYHNRSADSDFVRLSQLMEQADCVVLGPGLSVNENANKLVSYVLEHCNKKLIIDADAINCIAQNPVLLYNHTSKCKEKVVLTPHPKELSRFLSVPVSEILKDYAGISVKTAKEYGIIIVAKGASTIVTDGDSFYINTSGNEGMATAGSGDVLTGMIASIAARESSLFESTCKGVYLHGLCGDYCAKRIGKASLMARDLLDGIIYLNKND